MRKASTTYLKTKKNCKAQKGKKKSIIILLLFIIFRLNEEHGIDANIDYEKLANQYQSVPKQDTGKVGMVIEDQQTIKNKGNMIRHEHTPTTATSSNFRDHLFSAELIDPQTKKPIQVRKRFEGTIEKVLESRGSIFSGRDEQQILL